jgi:hypothetical protein
VRAPLFVSSVTGSWTRDGFLHEGLVSIKQDFAVPPF